MVDSSVETQKQQGTWKLGTWKDESIWSIISIYRFDICDSVREKVNEDDVINACCVKLENDMTITIVRTCVRSSQSARKI